MKKQPVMIIGGVVALVFALLAFLMPIAPGLVLTAPGITNSYCGYDFILSNDANMGITTESNGALMAGFIVLIVGTVFAALGSLLPLTGSTKFSGFLDIVAGLCLAATGVLYLLAQLFVPAVGNNSTWSLGYGFLVGGAAAAVGALALLVIGFMGMGSKKN